MEPTREPLTMYGSPSLLDRLEWTRVEDQLESAGGYWVVPSGAGHPHPRPVWGIWRDGRLYVSIGSPVIRAGAHPGGPVTVHLGSVNDVVIVEGTAAGTTRSKNVLDAYNAKYDWDYSAEQYGPLTIVEPIKVIAWRSAGWAGREGFRAASRWSWHSPTN